MSVPVPVRASASLPLSMAADEASDGPYLRWLRDALSRVELSRGRWLALMDSPAREVDAYLAARGVKAWGD